MGVIGEWLKEKFNITEEIVLWQKISSVALVVDNSISGKKQTHGNAGNVKLY